VTTGTPSATGTPAGVEPGTAQVVITVRYFAGARAASGVEQESIGLTAGATLTDLAAALADRHGAELARVLTASSYLIDEVAGPTDRTLADAATVDVLPPFAGG